MKKRTIASNSSIGDSIIQLPTGNNGKRIFCLAKALRSNHPFSFSIFTGKGYNFNSATEGKLSTSGCITVLRNSENNIVSAKLIGSLVIFRLLQSEFDTHRCSLVH